MSVLTSKNSQRFNEKTQESKREFWLEQSRWNKKVYAQVLSPLSDAVDIEKIWASDHWRDFVENIYFAACEWYHSCPQSSITRFIEEELESRYPKRDTPVWTVPSLPLARSKLSA